MMSGRSPVVVVTGRRCAGKSTVGELVRARGGIWIEASSYVARLRAQNPHYLPGALWGLIESGDVGRLIRQEIVKIDGEHPLVAITGLRYRSELSALETVTQLSVVTLVASSVIRYRRNIDRARPDCIASWHEWELSERQDDQFDLLSDPIGDLFSNDSSLAELDKLVDGFESGILPFFGALRR